MAPTPSCCSRPACACPAGPHTIMLRPCLPPANHHPVPPPLPTVQRGVGADGRRQRDQRGAAQPRGAAGPAGGGVHGAVPPGVLETNRRWMSFVCCCCIVRGGQRVAARGSWVQCSGAAQALLKRCLHACAPARHPTPLCPAHHPNPFRTAAPCRRWACSPTPAASLPPPATTCRQEGRLGAAAVLRCLPAPCWHCSPVPLRDPPAQSHLPTFPLSLSPLPPQDLGLLTLAAAREAKWRRVALRVRARGCCPCCLAGAGWRHHRLVPLGSSFVPHRQLLLSFVFVHSSRAEHHTDGLS